MPTLSPPGRIVRLAHTERSAGPDMRVAYVMSRFPRLTETFIVSEILAMQELGRAALHRGAHEFPLIVDSPAGPLDDQVRKEIGEMVPKLCEQFVAFTISTEREGFLPAIERSANGDIQYLTLFRQTIGTAHLMKSLPKTGVTKTKNAVLVTDRDYFVNFAVATEAEE